MSTISTPDSLKMVREHLCLAQGRLNGYLGEQERRAGEAIGRLIADIDRQRPLGPDGRHGDRHTATCGCAGHARNEQRSLAITAADIEHLQQQHPPVRDYDPTYWDEPVPGVEGLLGRQALWARNRQLLDAGVLRLAELIAEADDVELLYALQEEAPIWARAQGASRATLDLLEQMIDMRLSQIAMRREGLK